MRGVRLWLYIVMSGLVLGNLRRGFSVHMKRIEAMLVHSDLIKTFNKGRFITK